MSSRHADPASTSEDNGSIVTTPPPVDRVLARNAGEGYCVLTPLGPSPKITRVVWKDQAASRVTLLFSDGTERHLDGDTELDVAWHASLAAHDQVVVGATQLPPATLTRSDRVNAAYAAYIKGDPDAMRSLLGPFRSEVFIGDYEHWTPVRYGLALLAFDAHRVGDDNESERIARQLDVEVGSAQERISRKVLARLLASAIPASPSMSSVQEIVYRWARGGSDVADRPQLEDAYDRIVRLLRTA